MNKVHLILEGGGMRGAYTAGVLDCLIDANIEFFDIIGVSAGAANATQYLSKEKRRSIEILLTYSQDKRYLSYRNFLKKGSMFGMDFIFREIPNRLKPYDYEAANRSGINFEVVLTDVKTGKAEYILLQDIKEQVEYIIASSSLPLVSPIVEIDGKKYLDGGIADAIPLQYSLLSGFSHQVFVLTRPRKYRKTRSKLLRLSKLRYREYPKLIETMETRHVKYNQTLEMILERELKNQAIVIAPSKDIEITRTEKDQEKLLDLYHLGYSDASSKLEEITKLSQEVINMCIRKG